MQGGHCSVLESVCPQLGRPGTLRDPVSDRFFGPGVLLRVAGILGISTIDLGEARIFINCKVGEFFSPDRSILLPRLYRGFSHERQMRSMVSIMLSTCSGSGGRPAWTAALRILQALSSCALSSSEM